MENTPNSCDRSVTQGSPYTQRERANLIALAEVVATADMLRTAFPGRSLGSLRKRLSEQRRKMGMPSRRRETDLPTNISQTMLDPKDPGVMGSYEKRREDEWTRGSKQLLFAIQQMRSA